MREGCPKTEANSSFKTYFVCSLRSCFHEQGHLRVSFLFVLVNEKTVKVLDQSADCTLNIGLERMGFDDGTDCTTLWVNCW
jgi:hypothetical protein